MEGNTRKETGVPSTSFPFPAQSCRLLDHAAGDGAVDRVLTDALMLSCAVAGRTSYQASDTLPSRRPCSSHGRASLCPDAERGCRPPRRSPRLSATITVVEGHEPKPENPRWDVFISHASEDKDAIVRPLAAELRGRGIRVWYDEYELKIGDSLRASIEQGLVGSTRAIVVISPDFFAKHWAKEELNGLAALEAAAGRHRVLPVWHNVTHVEVARQAPMLADRLAGTTAEPIPELAVRIIEALSEDLPVEDQLPVVALGAELTKTTDSTVTVSLRNISSVHAINITLEPRQVEGRGVPITVAGSETILAGTSQTFDLERFAPEGEEARSLYDLLYTDPAGRVLKHQRLRFFLAPDVVTGSEFAGLVLERGGAEETFAPAALEPIDEHAENLVQAWLFSQEWLLTGSTMYLRALRALRGAPLDP
jgi:TIR domain-containing protein